MTKIVNKNVFDLTDLILNSNPEVLLTGSVFICSITVLVLALFRSQ